MYYIVTTTIHVPRLLAEYVRDFQEHGHDYTVVVAGDKKTPAAAEVFCQSLPNVVYLGIDDQRRLFQQLPLHDYIPFNSIDRRNFAYLYCLQRGFTNVDTLITIDDDNFLYETDFLGHHGQRWQTAPTSSASSLTWHNPLTRAYQTDIYPRGYSMYARYQTVPTTPSAVMDTTPIAVNQGLWNESPDLDALSRFMTNNATFEVKDSSPVVLGKNVLCPFDTQNTAYLNGFAATAFLCPFIGRFDDIFSSFITKRIADHLGYGLAFGAPVVIQRRNPHSTYHDFLLELHGMSLTETFASLLYTIPLQTDTIYGAYAELADRLRERLVHFAPLHHGEHQHSTILWSISQIPVGMKLWLECLDRLHVTASTATMIAASSAA